MWKHFGHIEKNNIVLDSIGKYLSKYGVSNEEIKKHNSNGNAHENKENALVRLKNSDIDW